MCNHVYACRGQKRTSNGLFKMLHIIPWRQGPSLNGKLDWCPANPIILLSLLPMVLSLQAFAWPCPTFYVGSRDSNLALHTAASTHVCSAMP